MTPINIPNLVVLAEEASTTPEATATVGSIFESVGTGFTEAVEWVGVVADTIVESPLLLIFVGIVPLIGLGIGMFKRMIAVN